MNEKRNPIQEAMTKIAHQANYYSIPVLDKLSDYDKGNHKGRKEGLLIAFYLMNDAITRIIKNWKEEK